MYLLHEHLEIVKIEYFKGVEGSLLFALASSLGFLGFLLDLLLLDARSPVTLVMLSRLLLLCFVSNKPQHCKFQVSHQCYRKIMALNS